MAHSRAHTRSPTRCRQSPLACAVLLLGLVNRAFTAETCISLDGSTQCPAFNASSISTDADMVALYSFLSDVTDLTSFDSGLEAYIAGAWVTEQYSTLLGCSAYNSSDPSEYYARYTTSVLCNAIIQSSATTDRCNLTGTAATPLCADTCALFSEDETSITDSAACGTAGDDAASQIRADFTNCALPADSLGLGCIEGATNQPDNCGFADNLSGLCTYCGSSSANSTDSCCVNSDVTTRCAGVTLPVVGTATATSSGASSTATASASSTSSAITGASHSGLSRAQIAGIVVGTILGISILLGIIITTCLLMRRRGSRSGSPGSGLNQPNPPRKGASPIAAVDGAGARDAEKSEALPGGRVTQLSALSGDGAEKEYAGGLLVVPRSGYHSSDTDAYDDRAFIGRVPPKRHRFDSEGRPIAAGALAATDEEDTFSSPEDGTGTGTGTGTGQSEQLAFFKDYYSHDEIHVGDLVSTLWAYQPRAQDEHELERGDMLKVTGIWDDGWATGMRIRKRADHWREPGQRQRDSGMSDSSYGESSAEGLETAEVKAFPLVCVCLPRVWRETVESESDDTRRSDED